MGSVVASDVSRDVPAAGGLAGRFSGIETEVYWGEIGVNVGGVLPIGRLARNGKLHAARRHVPPDGTDDVFHDAGSRCHGADDFSAASQIDGFDTACAKDDTAKCESGHYACVDVLYCAFAGR